MSHEPVSTRDEVAAVAAEMAGRAVPLPQETPKRERKYLYATPVEDGGHFPIGDLTERLDEAGIRVGIDRDPASDEFGVRYIARNGDVPAALMPFSGRRAREEWKNWNTRRSEMAEHVADAATRLAAGEIVDFSGDDRLHDHEASALGKRVRGNCER